MKDMNNKVRAIAFYLPQFYPTPENDEWWEPGFTEWTNVARSKPLFRGHYQPRIPRDLGFYDLRVPEVREQQAQLAREAGIEGFCYWHYWFAGRRLLDKVFREVVESGKPDFPFCLCWANHSWYQKTWDPTRPDRLLIEQTYPGEQDYIDHFYALLPAFKDKRYMKVDGKLVFGIFNAGSIPSFNLMKRIWNELAQQNGLDGFWFFGLIQKADRVEDTVNKGYDALVYENMSDIYDNRWSEWLVRMKHIYHQASYLPYHEYVSRSISFYNNNPNYIPCLMPNFDHSPRSSYRGRIMTDNSPKEWGRLLREVSNIQIQRGLPLVFIKAWNEWGEGNYLEPDCKFGKQYLEMTRKVLVE